MKTLIRYCKPFFGAMLFGLAIKSVGAIAELLLPYILEHLLDHVVPLGQSEPVFMWGVVMAVCALVAWGFNINANRRASAVARDVTQAIRHDLFKKTISLSCADADHMTIPSLEARLTSDTYNTHRMLGMMQRMGFRAPILLVGGLVMVFLMEPVLALVMVGLLPFMGVLVWFRATQGIPLFKRMQAASDRMIAVVRENVQGIRVIKALSRTEYEKQRYQQVNDGLYKEASGAHRKMALINPMMTLLLNIGLSLVILAGAYRVNAGISDAGRIVAFLSYFTIISNAMMTLSRMFIMYSNGIASADRIGEVLQIKDQMEIMKDLPSSDPQYEIEFKDLSFSYNKKQDNVADINIRLKKGETLGIIGATGSGKTTLISLLLRFYDPDEGAVYLNGTDIRTLDPHEFRRRFGIVMQNDFLYSGTIKENIAFGREIAEDDMRESVINAQAFDFIDSNEEGLDYHLSGKGNNLSGGQRQRVLLSRAFSGHPDILILDDSSSALDYGTDARLRKALNNEYPDITTIIIAQRVSSIAHADQIIVMDEGRIVSRGTHEQLMKSSPIYSSIAASQMGGALID